MFRKKKIQEEEVVEVIEELNEETIKPQKQSKVASKVNERVSPLAFFEMSKKEDPETKTSKEPKEEVTQTEGDEVLSVVVGADDPWIWANTEEYEEKLEKESKKKRKKRGKKEEVVEETEEKKNLSVFFEENKTKNKKLKIKDAKKVEDDKDKPHRKSKRQQLEEDVKNQKVFRYDGKKYSKVEDFITYLNQHYLDIETIAAEILDDENFFGWVNKNSGRFAASLKEFKEIQAKIENKS